MPLTSTRISEVAIKNKTTTPPETSHVVESPNKETAANILVKEELDNTEKKPEEEKPSCSNISNNKNDEKSDGIENNINDENKTGSNNNNNDENKAGTSNKADGKKPGKLK